MRHQSWKRVFSVLLVCCLLVAGATVLAQAARPKSIKTCTISVASPVVFTGKAKKAQVSVKDGKTVLRKGREYTLSYANNTNVGVATVTVSAKKNSGYTGTKTMKFKIVPRKVGGLTAVKRTPNAVTLQWNAVPGADGYVVFGYDAASGTYIKLKTAAGPRRTVTALAENTTYRFAVRAFSKANGKRIYGAYSAALKVKTPVAAQPATEPHQQTFRMAQYQTILKSGTYQMTFTTNDPELGKTPITFATKNGNRVIDTKIQRYDCKMLYFAERDVYYLLLDDFKKYCELPKEAFFDEPSIRDGIMVDWSPNMERLTASEMTVNGITYACESSMDDDGMLTRYLFDGDTLVQIDSVEPNGDTSSMYISRFTGDVPDAMLQIPKGYGYLNLSWLFR